MCSWFVDYATSLNMTRAATDRFLVLVHAKRHDELVLANQASYLTPFSAHSKTMKKAGSKGKPASHAYVCRRPSTKLVKKHILKRPAACILRRPAKNSRSAPQRAQPAKCVRVRRLGATLESSCHVHFKRPRVCLWSRSVPATCDNK